jgi:hypothetical protein
MKKLASLCAVALAVCAVMAAPAFADDAARTKQPAGQKLDSGLGELPHYRYWADKSGKNPTAQGVAGEKLDSGLGDIAPFSLGRNGLPRSVDVAQRN